MSHGNDIVARLRDLKNAMDECGFTGISAVTNLAADEIERLRKERDEAEPLLNELWERRTEATEMRSEIERLRNALVDSEREVTMLTRGMRIIIDNAHDEPLAADYARALLEGRQMNRKDGRGWKNESLQD